MVGTMLFEGMTPGPAVAPVAAGCDGNQLFIADRLNLSAPPDRAAAKVACQNEAVEVGFARKMEAPAFQRAF
jgi:hypothetical protein